MKYFENEILTINIILINLPMNVFFGEINSQTSD